MHGLLECYTNPKACLRYFFVIQFLTISRLSGADRRLPFWLRYLVLGGESNQSFFSHGDVQDDVLQESPNPKCAYGALSFQHKSDLRLDSVWSSGSAWFRVPGCAHEHPVRRDGFQRMCNLPPAARGVFAPGDRHMGSSILNSRGLGFRVTAQP